jgi:methionine-rich copper-binding protein CopC
MRLRVFVSAAGAGVILLVSAGPTVGHGVLDSSLPRQGARLKKPPRHVRLTFTEAPTRQTSVKVRDGCGDDVVGSIVVAGDDAHVGLIKGQPGRYRVSFRVISSVDGHATKGRMSFVVAGERDCSNEPDDKETQAAPPPAETEDEGGAGLAWVAVGAAALVGLAVAARKLAR